MKDIAEIVTVFRLFNNAIEDVGNMFLQNTGAPLPEYMQCSPKLLDRGVLLIDTCIRLFDCFICYLYMIFWNLAVLLSSSERNMKPNLLD